MPKRGDTRGDGKVFWARAKDCKNGEHWVTPEKFASMKSRVDKWEGSNKSVRRAISQRYRERSKEKDNRPAPQDRKLSRGDMSHQGMVFWAYHPTASDGEIWLDRVEFERRMSRIPERVAEWYKNNPSAKLAKAISNRVAIALKGGHKKTSSTKLLGCSIEHLRDHLESQFEEGMSWDNHSMTGWHIDHIRPCASFDLTDEAQQRECFHYKNLQPLWAKDNLSKNAKYIL